MQGKGGVGKSFISSILAQHKKNSGNTPSCLDTDPINATFYGFKDLNVQRLEIMDGDEINSRHFDSLIDLIANTSQDYIIDNGASSFVPLSHYLISNKVPALLKGLGHQLIIHTVITGGQALLDTMNGFSQLINQFSEETLFVVWLNPYWGPIEHEGRGFEQMKVYKENKDRVSAIITIPALKEETYGRDLTDMLQERITFDEAINSPSRSIMVRQRLKIVRDQLFGQLNNAVVL